MQEIERSTTRQIMNENFVDITLDEVNNVVIAYWKGYLRLNEVIEGCSKMTKLIQNRNIKGHVSDHTRLKVLSKEIQDYLTGQWFGEAAKAGLTKIAVNVSDDVFAQATVNKVNTAVTMGTLQINTYNSYKECTDWLETN